jgi:AraC family transcriptional regulator
VRNLQQASRINDALHYIHGNINSDLSAKTLAGIAQYSEQHFHRIFYRYTQETVNQFVRRTRLETAANQLMFAPASPVVDIAHKCGFNSLASFSHAFKKQFKVPPGKWRTHDNALIQPPYLDNPEIAAAYLRLSDLPLADVEFVQLDACYIAYIRHLGYDRSIKKTWNILLAWANTEGYAHNDQFGLHHSNPTQTPLDKCHYVAGIEIDRLINRRGTVHSMQIPGGLHAKFALKGKYGELLPSISKIQQQWLPSCGLIAKTTPAIVKYQKNQFLESDETFALSYYLPLSFY